MYGAELSDHCFILDVTHKKAVFRALPPLLLELPPSAMAATTETLVVPSHGDFTPRVSISYFDLAATAVRGIYGLIFYENPLLWYYRLGRHNVNADMEGERSVVISRILIITRCPGPLYIIGAPRRQIDEGKAILANIDLLKSTLPEPRLQAWRS